MISIKIKKTTKIKNHFFSLKIIQNKMQDLSLIQIKDKITIIHYKKKKNTNQISKWQIYFNNLNKNKKIK